jgi:RNA polymerase sigma-70 factor (ECF subfamily)
MLGGRPEAEDAVQEAFLRAWSHRARFEGRSSYRTWLFRIATNTCVDVLRRPATQRSLAVASVEDHARDAPGRTTPVAQGPWWATSGPDDALVSRETVELALLAALEHLPARQRAVLCLRDLLGWASEDTAELLGTTVPAVNSALQRARATLRSRQPADRQAWSPASAASRHRRRLVRRLMDAGDRDDGPSVASLLALAS